MPVDTAPAPAAAVAGKKGKKGKKGADGAAKGGRKKKIVIIAVVLVAAAAAYLLVLKPAPAVEDPHAEPEPGAVVALDALTVNLAGGHFLRVGLGLQLALGKALVEVDPHAEAVAEVDPKADGAKALDAAITVFSGKSIAQLSGPGRTQARQALVTELEKRYDGAVMDVYFTEFVMQ